MSEGMMSRRAFCRSAAGGAVGLALRGALGGTTRPAERPNILMVVTDDLGCQVGCYGDPIARTPNIDGLAAEGVRFTRAYVTQASCSPSRSSMFTGMYPHQNGQIGLAHRGYSMRPGLKTLPALLKAAGYRTGVLGKVHVKPGRDLPFDFHQFNATGTRDVARTAKVADGFMHGGRGKPFFLMVNLFDPHRPFENTFRGLPKQPLGPDDVKPPPFLGVDAPEVRKEVAGYYNCAARADAGLGMLLRALARNGCEKNTIVMFLGDHGPPFPRAKLSCYEAGIRIPLVIRWPGRIEAGLVSDALVSTIDFLPTLMEAAGGQTPEGLPGRSLAPLFDDAKVPWRELLFAEYNSHTHTASSFFPRRCVRDDRYKLIVNLLHDRDRSLRTPGAHGAAWEAAQQAELDGMAAGSAWKTLARPPEVELYDLKTDPVEFRNLADRADSRPVLQRLQKELLAWRKRTDDPLLDRRKLAALARRHGAGEVKPRPGKGNRRKQ